MRQQSIGPEYVRAQVITKVAVHSAVFTRADLVREIEPARDSDVGKAVRWFREIGWLRLEVPEPTSEAHWIHKIPLTCVTQDFWMDFEHMTERLELARNDRKLYREGIAERQAMESLTVGTLEYDHAEANYLGRATLLGARHDLAGSHGWFKGLHGWTSLITIEACRPEA